MELLLVYQTDIQLLVLRIQSTKTEKAKLKSSGFVNVEKEGDKLKIKFRFFKYNKGASPTVSTKVYEAIIS
ncbi:variable surface lipoprotein [Mycoplasmopsis bovis]|nr:variable surface lipoprotein [Mycoplasmopsis bovis]WHL49651.1 variable surface lipoprotein [Mycoplasmopsis bovis]